MPPTKLSVVRVQVLIIGILLLFHAVLALLLVMNALVFLIAQVASIISSLS